MFMRYEILFFIFIPHIIFTLAICLGPGECARLERLNDLNQFHWSYYSFSPNSWVSVLVYAWHSDNMYWNLFRMYCCQKCLDLTPMHGAPGSRPMSLAQCKFLLVGISNCHLFLLPLNQQGRLWCQVCYTMIELSIIIYLPFISVLQHYLEKQIQQSKSHSRSQVSP